jgi:thiamine monophosphate synthase
VCPLHAILDAEAAVRGGWQPAELGRMFLEAGARCVQLRAKRLPFGPFLHLADDLVGVAAPTAGDGDRERSRRRRQIVGRVRRPRGPDRSGSGRRPPICSARMPSSAFRPMMSIRFEAARLEPVTYIAVGPVFETGSKETGYAPVGLAFVREATRLAGGLPIVAIGGITLETAPSVLDAGAASVAVISDLLVRRPG